MSPISDSRDIRQVANRCKPIEKLTNLLYSTGTNIDF